MVLGTLRYAGFLVTLLVTLSLLCTPAAAKTPPNDSHRTAAKSAPSKKKAEKKSEKKKSAKSSKKANEKKKASTKEKAPETAGEKSPDKVKIESDDPKAITKTLLLDKKGVEYEIVEPRHQPPPKRQPQTGHKKKVKPATIGDTFDFSTMLLPITHEALVGSPYGIRSHRLHRGVDVNVIKDEPVVAAYPGEVIMSRYNKGGYGNYVLIQHPNGLQTLYAHLSKRLLSVGDEVYPGDIVGLAGNSGRSSAAHLHFEIRYGDVNIDPTTVIDFPHWCLRKGVEKFSMKKATADHRKLQAKLKSSNFYIVKEGDTQGDVANWFNISVESLNRINNLKPGSPLKVGQKLYGSKQ